MISAVGTTRAVLRSVAIAAPSINANAAAFSHQDLREVFSKTRTSANGITSTSIVVAARPCSVGPTTVTRFSRPKFGWITVGDLITLAIGARIARLHS